jgi:hypothetical protein
MDQFSLGSAPLALAGLGPGGGIAMEATLAYMQGFTHLSPRSSSVARSGCSILVITACARRARRARVSLLCATGHFVDALSRCT